MGRVQEAPERTWLSADQLPEATPVVPPEKTPKEPSKRHPQPKNAARKLQRQTVVLPPKKPPIPDSTEAVKPEGTQGQSAPPQRTPRWLPSRWPEAPPPGRFGANPAGSLDGGPQFGVLLDDLDNA